MIKRSALGLLLAAPIGAGQITPPTVQPVLTHAQAQGLSRDPSAVLVDPVAVAALAAFVAPLQQHAPPDPESGAIGALFDALPKTLMVPVEVSGTMLWVAVSTNPPDDALPSGFENGSQVALDRYVGSGDGEPLTDPEAVCPPDGANYHVWTVVGVGRVEGCLLSAE